MRPTKVKARHLTSLWTASAICELGVKSSVKVVIGRISIAFKEKYCLFKT